MKKPRGFSENFLNGKIRTAQLAATPHMCISSELLPLFLFYLAVPHRAALVCNGLDLVVDKFTPGYQFRPTLNFLEDLYFFIDKMFTKS